MGRVLVTTDITSEVGLPIKKGTLDFLQAAYKEPIESILKALIGFSNGFIVLQGCVNTGGTLPTETATISAGYIFNTATGELYLVPAANFVIGASEVIVGNFVTNNYINGTEADPVTFTDGIPHNIHKIETIVFSSGASGSGEVDYIDLEYVYSTGSYVPVLEAFDSSDNSLGLITYTNPVFYSYNLFERNLFILLRLITIDTPANTNYIRVSVPITVPSGKTIAGGAYADVIITGGNVYSSFIYGAFNSGGAGDPLTLRKITRTNYGALNNLEVYCPINLRIL